MDPLAIAAGIIGLATSISSVNAGIRWIASLRKAPAEFLDLQNELETVQGYLHTLKPILDNLPGANDSAAVTSNLAHIAHIYRAFEDEIRKLAQIADSFRTQSFRPDATGRPEIKRLRWRRSSEIIRTHRDHIRRLRLELATAVTLLQPAQSSLILGLQQASNDAIRAITSTIEKSTKRLQLSIDGLSSNQAMIIHAIPTERKNPCSVLGGLHTSNGRYSLADTANDNQDLVQLEATIRQRCSIQFQCQCHRSRVIRRNNNEAIRAILGSFLLDYNCNPVWDHRHCNDSRCVNGTTTASGDLAYLRLVYLFPAWILRRALHLNMSWASLTGEGATLHIRVPRVLPNSHQVFWAIDNKRFDLVRSNISSSKALPNDVNEFGQSLLHIAMLNFDSSLEIADYLFSLTKNLNAMDLEGRSAVSLSRNAIRGGFLNLPLNKNLKPVYEKILRQCVLEESYDTGESLIHRAVFRDGSTDLSLEEAIALDPTSIDRPDADGLTPIHWAARRRDVNSVRLLLAHGADPNVLPSKGSTPQRSAHPPGGDDMVNLLLDYGADINLTSNDGGTPLVEAVRMTSLGIFYLMLSRGAKAGYMKSRVAATVIHYLADFSNAAVQIPMLDALVKAGYDINIPNAIGWPPIFYSVWHNTAIGVRALTNHGADLTMRDKQGRSILHVTGLFATREVMEVLEERIHDIPGGVDPEGVDSEGRTAMDCLRERLAMLSPEDVDAFGRLVGAARRSWIEGHVVWGRGRRRCGNLGVEGLAKMRT